MHNNGSYTQTNTNKRRKLHYDINHDMARVGYVFPFVVVIMILSPYFFLVIYVLIPWLGLTSFSGIINILWSTVLDSMIVLSYIKCLVTPPGSPGGWIPDLESPEYDPLSPDGAKRYCQKCIGFKPPRAHHCRVCNKCILKMDHHCPWINNCVGHDNHKFFILFLVYAVVGIFYALVVLLICFIDALFKTGVEDFVIIFGFTITATLLLPVGLAIATLLVWQLWLIFRNMTSIEHEEKEKLKRLFKREGKVFHFVNKYNTGSTIENLRGVFGGGGFISWVLPTRPIPDGVNFKRDYHSNVSKV